MKRGGLAVPILNEAGQPVGIASTTKFHSPAVFSSSHGFDPYDPWLTAPSLSMLCL
jgi:hypothetical protein